MLRKIGTYIRSIKKNRDLVEMNDGKLNISFPRQLLQIALARYRGYTVEDYYVLGMYEGKNWDKMGSLRYNKVNRFLDRRVTGVIEFNKWIFINYFESLGFSVPKTYGFFHPEKGYLRDHSDFRTCDDLFRFLHNHGNSLVIKPINGAKGRDVLVIEKIIAEQSLLLRPNGSRLTFEDLHRTLTAKDLMWLFQEKVIQSESYAAFNPTSVNTVRLNTLVMDDGQIILASGIFRMGRTNSEIDNVSGGGIAALIDRDTGILIHGMTSHSQRRFEKHPDTGAQIKGRRLPMWDRIKRNALLAHRLLPFTRYLSWDIAVTDDGPVFLEVNSFGAENFYEKYDGMNLMDLEIGKIYKENFKERAFAYEMVH